MLYVLNAFPNSFLPTAGNSTLLVGINEAGAKEVLASNPQFISAVGHSSFAEIVSIRLGVTLPTNRITVNYSEHDQYLIAAVSPPRRLAEGESWTEEEILLMPITYVYIG